MKNKRMLFEKIPNTTIFYSIILIFFVKIIIFILINNNLLSITLGGGNDADYYDSYARGEINVAVNIWPIILRHLNDLNIYSRELLPYVLLFLNLIFIPILACKLAGLSFHKNQKYYIILIFICLIYPTLYFYTWDIYRDVFMVFSFLVGCTIVKKSINSKNFLSFIFYSTLSVMMGLFLTALRPYLGYGFLLSLFLWKAKLTKKRLFIFGFLYIISLYLAYSIGALDSLVEYRAGFESMGGGSTMNLDFTNPVLFIPNLFLSTLGQLFGLYITNPLAIVIFLIETVPFIFMLSYIIKNIKLADNFLRFLIIFFVLYASVWLIGNDNLGTAVRLRMYNYLAVYICFFSLVKLKKQMFLSENTSS